MATPVPTVHERLARCGTRVYVTSLVPMAEVVLSIDTDGTITEFTHTATGGSHTFVVPALVPGASVRARQDEGAGFTPSSPVVVVEDAVVPPVSGPGLPGSVGTCSHCVWVDGLVPGCEVKLWVGSELVGQDIASRTGKACVSVNVPDARRRPGTTLRARMYVCGAESPASTTTLVAEPTLPKPKIKEPLFECQREIPLSNLHRGALVRVQVTDLDGTETSNFCCCSKAFKAHLGSALGAGADVRAQLFWTGKPCAPAGSWSAVASAVPPVKGVKPVILGSLIAGDQIIRVADQVLDASLQITIEPEASLVTVELGPVAAGLAEEIALNAPLEAGDVVSVVQTLCGYPAESDPVTVKPQPTEVLAPIIIPPLYACGAAVQVSNLHFGALVRVFADGIPIGVEWAGEATSLTVPVAPFLAAATQVSARQWVGGVESPESNAVTVTGVVNVQKPRILPPVAKGDTTVWVSRVVPGARVTIHSDGQEIGEIAAAEPVVRVPVSPVSGPIRAKARLCGKPVTGNEVTPITSPSAAGSFPAAGETFVSYGAAHIPPTKDGDEFYPAIEGQLYFPATASKKLHPDATSLPLVVIAHGFFYGAYPSDSYLGYSYLARHLARWGMLVFSIRMDDANHPHFTNTDADLGKYNQYARVEIIFRAISELLADPEWNKRINRNRIGLIGHSMTGEAVGLMQWVNATENRGVGIKGVVGIAAVHYRPEYVVQSKYMQIMGSMDFLVGDPSSLTGPDPDPDAVTGFTGSGSSLRAYDRAWRLSKSHFFVYGALHHPFNRVWEDWYESVAGTPEAISRAEHERVAKCLINAFFQDALLEKAEYAGYMQGTILPRSLDGLEIQTQHGRLTSLKIIDNFGEPELVALIPAQPLDRTVNTKGQAVTVTGAGPDDWEDLEHKNLSNSPHNTKGARLSWSAPGVVYRSETGGVSAALTDVLSLRVAQFYPDEARNPEDQPADLFVTLSDGFHEATVRLGAVAQIPYPVTQLSMMRTVRLPIDAFKAMNPAFSPASVKSVALWLAARPTGNILIDDIEFSR